MGDNYVSDLINLSVADLTLQLDLRNERLKTMVHSCHDKFLTTRSQDDGLVLFVEDGIIDHQAGWVPLYFPSRTWELWREISSDNFLFVAPPSSPPQRSVIVDSSFSRGRVVGNFQASSKNGIIPYPLQDIDLVIYVNWLSALGDLVLHASGIQVDGKGYCFIGFSGAGKSTIVADLSLIPGVTVLGEDNLVLRFIQGKFMIFGTPWHLNPAMCSATGVPLEKIFFLDRTKPSGQVNCGASEGITRLLQTAFIPYYNSTVISGLLDRLDQLAENLQFYWLSYQRGADLISLILDH